MLQQLIVSIYEEKLDGKDRIHIHNNTVIDGIATADDGVSLKLRECYLNTVKQINVDALVLATGFKDLGAGPSKEPYPRLLEGVARHLERRADSALNVKRDYRVENALGPHLYLNGLCESSHGLGDAGSFSLLSIRSAEILESLKLHLSQDNATPEIAAVNV